MPKKNNREAIMRVRRIINAVRGNIVAWLALFVASIAVAPPAASAHCGQFNPCVELEIQALSPPIGSSFEEGNLGPWVMIAPHGLGVVTVNVNTSPATGSDGRTLSDLYRAEYPSSFYFFESSTDEGVYTSYGPSRYLKAGTYYWQMEAEYYHPPGVEYQTPIYSFVVTPKPAPPSPPAAPPPSPPSTPPKPQPVVSAPPPSVPSLLPRFEGEIEPSVGSHSGHRWRVGSKIKLQLLDRRFAHTRYRVSINWSNVKNMHSRSFWRVTGAQEAWSSITITAPQKPGHYSVTWTVVGRVIARWKFDAVR
jgi:hypothetical protein